MALFGIARVKMTGIAFVEFRGLPKAGHATQPQCYAAYCRGALTPEYDAAWEHQRAANARRGACP